MPLESQRIEVVLETLLESVTLAEGIAVSVAAAAGFSEDDQYKIGMAVHEGVKNAFRYGNEQQRERKIRVLFELFDEKMVIHVADQGMGFRLEDIPDPRTDENMLKDSGRGILLMRTFMDEFDVQAVRGGGAEIIMAKRYRAHP
jgi:serine/threonine-protein kinase RsbW